MTRNLAEYPITLNEKLGLLRHYQLDVMGEEAIGDLRPLILQKIIEDVRARHFYNLD